MVQAVVILGVGRCGTSMLMSLLSNWGMTTDGGSNVTGVQNVKGDFEDQEIVKVHGRILKLAGAHPQLPLTQDLLDVPGVSTCIDELVDIVERKTRDAKAVWGFKDPKTMMLLPVWTRVFNKTHVVPKYVLAVREPGATAASFKKNYNIDQSLAELGWLCRYIDGIVHTGGDCFVVNYENWFSQGRNALARSLLEFCGFDDVTDEKINEVIGENVKPSLDRSSRVKYEVKNSHVKAIYDVLKRADGKPQDLERLMRTVSDARDTISEYSGWHELASKYHKWFKDQKKGAEPGTSETALAKDNRLAVDVANAYLNKLKRCQTELEELRVRGTITSVSIPDEVGDLRSSYTYRVGQAVIKSVSKPGKNTLKLPLELYRIFSDRRRSRAS